MDVLFLWILKMYSMGSKLTQANSLSTSKRNVKLGACKLALSELAE
jgi:hypothetical protein